MKRNKTVLATAVALGVVFTATAAEACSRLIWETENHGVFVSRTMDWMVETHPTIDVRAKGQSYLGADSGTDSKQWTSKYASIMATFYGKAGVDGFNEAGLAANALYFNEESPGDYTAERPQLENSRIVPYILDNYATVEEAVAGLKKIQIQQFSHNGEALKGHYAIQDASGDSAILEFIDGQWEVYHGKQYDVLTNSPEYHQHLKSWEEQQPKSQSVISGSFTLPGNVASEQRFIWNKYMLEQLEEPTSYLNGLAKINSSTYHVPLDAANREIDGVMTSYATQYSLAYNLDQKIMHVRYQFGDVYTQYAVDFNKLNNGKNYTLKADSQDNVGEVSHLFIDKEGVMAQYRI
ncbi:linear amide C-N hydrolase [Photobacterium alginatilyticum]|uniref:Linear amide C-N hydrolase n=1 Tax=Photobacterium alginatilyticum TaxID=1775171 RepID=A0ABW9YK74_9GAMM|nr:linear amide C-N hydrolase [Photobacterium alginatilyticum]NBI53800.1 linear amide C-N hydrolase [Photobacterium alginatilyticum]